MNIWLSIIVPVYNIEKYINQCINSLILQNEKNYEIILVNDGSTDKSGEICDYYASKYDFIKSIKKTNGGLSDARNKGIDHSQGEYILFVDGDDFIVKNSLKKIHFIIIKKKKPDVVFLECMKFFDKNKNTVSLNDGITEKIDQLKETDIYTYLGSLPKYPASACSKAIKRSFLKENNLYFKKGLLCEDLEWSSRVFSKIQHAAYCPAEYYMYRQQRKGSISNSQSKKKTYDLLNIFMKIIDRAESSEETAEKMMQLSFAEYIFRLIVLDIDTLTKKDFNIFEKKLKTKKYILGTRRDLPSRMIYFSYKLLGLKGANFILKIYLKIRAKLSR